MPKGNQTQKYFRKTFCLRLLYFGMIRLTGVLFVYYGVFVRFHGYVGVNFLCFFFLCFLESKRKKWSGLRWVQRILEVLREGKCDQNMLYVEPAADGKDSHEMQILSVQTSYFLSKDDHQ